MMRERWTGKEFGITIGFSLIYFAIVLLIQMSGALSPVPWIFMTACIAAFAWIPYMYLTARVQKPGIIVVMNGIVAAVYLIVGELANLLIITMAAATILAELARKAGGYDSFQWNLISYLILCFSMVGSPLYVWLYHAHAMEECTEKFSSGYAAAADALSTPGMLIVMLALTAVLALAGGLLSKKLYGQTAQKRRSFYD